MRKEIKTKKQLIERLNEIDRKCIDEGTHFYDFKTFNLTCNSKNGKSLFILKISFLRKEYPISTSFSKDPHFFF